MSSEQNVEEGTPLRKRDVLARFIKDVHSKLRVQANSSGDPEHAWMQHCLKKDLLKEYAASMRELATEHWNQNLTARTQWIESSIKHYFENSNLQSGREREKQKLQNFVLFRLPDTAFSYPELPEHSCDVIEVLDVGSSYNPLDCIEAFKVTAIDIAPADPTVFECDFLSVKLGDSLDREDCRITQLTRESYHAVVFSLLLEYLPTKSLRLSACKKAYELLRPEGLLIIITPDSKHPTANAKLIKSWRIALAILGFSRIAYEKQKHVHCMMFRKVPPGVPMDLWRKMALSSLNRNKEVDDLDELMYISQDRNLCA